MKPQRLQLKRTKGWRMPPNTVKVDRSTKWGNPHRVGLCGICEANHTQEEAVLEYKSEVEGWNKWRQEIIKALKGKNLSCWCKIGEHCHADVLLAIANEYEA